MLWFAVLFLLGVLMASGYTTVAVWGIVIVIFTGFIGNGLWNIRWYWIVVAFLLFAAGFVRTQYFEEPKEAFGYIKEPIKVNLQGRVSSVKLSFKLMVTLEDAKVLYNNEEYSVNEVLVYFSDAPKLRLGDVIAVSGNLSSFEKPHNDGEFNVYEYYKSQGIYYTLEAGADGSIYKFSAEKFSLKEYLYSIREALRTRIFKYSYDAKDAGTLTAMILGDKEYLDEELEERFQGAGVSHILVVSGLHISLLGMAVFRLLRRVTGYAVSCSVSAVFVVLYVLMTGFGISGQRALIMFLVSMGANYLGRTYDMICSASLALLLMLFERPYLFLNSGFLLSFLAVFGIALLLPVLEDLAKWAVNKKMSGVMIMFAIGLATTPVSAHYFYRYPIYTILINLVVVPTSSLLVIVTIVGLAGEMIIEKGEILIKGPIHIVLEFYEGLCETAEGLPGNSLLLGQAETGQVIIVYSMLVIIALVHMALKQLLKHTKRKAKLPMMPKVIMMSVVIILVCVVELMLLRVSAYSDMVITMLDVGQGDCIFVETPSGERILIDSGSSDVRNLYEERIAPFFEARGVSAIDYIIVSHADTDHCNAIIDMLELAGTAEAPEVGALVLPELIGEDERLEELARLAMDAGAKVVRASEGDVIEVSEKVTLNILSPQEGVLADEDEKNDNSLVMSLSYGEFDMLFTGDIGTKTEKKIMDLVREYEVLKVAHHGSKYSSGEELVECVKPVVSLISCGADNYYGHPHADTLARLSAVGSNIFITAEDRQIRIYTDGEEYKVETCYK